MYIILPVRARELHNYDLSDKLSQEIIYSVLELTDRPKSKNWALINLETPIG